MTEIDPVRKVPEKTSTGDTNLDSILTAIERTAEGEIERNARVLNNQLLASDSIIANVAALKSINSNEELLKLALEAANQNPLQLEGSQNK